MSLCYAKKRNDRYANNFLSAGVNMKPNIYFDGKVVSWTIEQSEDKATLGCISPGEYEFRTGVAAEHMTILSGKAKVSIKDGPWKEYGPEDSFHVPCDAFGGKFKVRVEEGMVSYHCYYFISLQEDFDEEAEKENI